MSKKLHFALFHANPATNPPFTLEVGLDGEVTEKIESCEHIPDALLRLEAYRHQHQLEYGQNFTLLYPIYMEAMDTDDERTMLEIAWLIKDEADARKWNFGRIGGLTGRTIKNFFND